MLSKRASSALEKLHLKKDISHPTSKACSKNCTTATASMLGETTKKLDSSSVGTSETVQPSEEMAADADSKTIARTGDHDAVSTTNSSPVDPMYVPTNLSQGGRITQSPTLLKAPPTTPARPISTIGKSFFDFESSDSGDDEPVVGRASSVRMSKPHIVYQQHNFRDQAVHSLTPVPQSLSSPESPLSSHLNEVSETSPSTTEAEENENKRGGSADALRMLEGKEIRRASVSSSDAAAIQDLDNDQVVPSDNQKRGGLFLNPIIESDKPYIQRATSAPTLPQRHSSNKKVKIRPADLIIGHTKTSARLFREAVVTTPYPTFTKSNEKDIVEEPDSDEKITALPRRSGTVKSTRFEADRFPSPDRPEVLFFDLGLARHPSATTTLEIRVADKSAYDDEMLFRQIRAAYRSRLLGVSRFPFCLIRGVTHATVSSSVQYDFKPTDFMKHFNNPRIGRKRKTWIIWLRHHSSQPSSGRSENLNVVKRPLSASLRTADKRLSMQSDSTSTFNFSFLPPLSIPRIPFFNKEAMMPSSASTYHAPPGHGLEDGSGTIKVELHHEFSFWMLAFSCFWLITFSIAAVICWTVFGVPGSRPGDNDTAVLWTKGLSWNTAAQTRVLTGLVLGMMVALLGAMVEICLVAGAYIML